MTELFKTAIDWYFANLNYGTIFLFMAIESTFLPFPSEVIIPPAAFKAAAGDMNLFFVIISGILGSLTGATINYIISITLGRPIIHSLAKTKFAKLLMIKEESVTHAEEYFNHFGKSATFIGRLVPGVRHLISIPAGLAKMPIVTFWLFTALGSLIWTSILAALGFFLYGQKDLLNHYFVEITWGLLIVGLAFLIFIITKGILNSNKKKKQKT